ncbi:hypothetical protein ISCGN_026858 [Ixodes scapularis]
MSQTILISGDTNVKSKTLTSQRVLLREEAMDDAGAMMGRAGPMQPASYGMGLRGYIDAHDLTRVSPTERSRLCQDIRSVSLCAQNERRYQAAPVQRQTWLLHNGGAQLGTRRRQCVCAAMTSLLWNAQTGEAGAAAAAPARQLCAV